jgi:hypothetical protein
MQINKSVGRGLVYNENILIRKPSAIRSFGPLRLPLKLSGKNIGLSGKNFGNFVRFHHEAFTNYVFHAPSLTMGIGSLTSEHNEIARTIIDHPDVRVENQESLIGGTLQLWPLGNKKAIITIDRVYGSFGYNDLLKAFEFLVGLANVKAAGFKVLDQHLGKDNKFMDFHAMLVEDKLPLK